LKFNCRPEISAKNMMAPRKDDKNRNIEVIIQRGAKRTLAQLKIRISIVQIENESCSRKKNYKILLWCPSFNHQILVPQNFEHLVFVPQNLEHQILVPQISEKSRPPSFRSAKSRAPDFCSENSPAPDFGSPNSGTISSTKVSPPISDLCSLYNFKISN